VAENSDQNILVVEDEELMRAILRELLEGAGYSVITADSAESALEAYSAAEIAVTLTDIKLPGRSGIEFLDQIKSLDDEAVVIVITAFSSVDSAIAALRKGAYDYVTKPFVNEDLLQTVKNAAKQRKLFHENRFLKRELRRQYDISEMVGKSEAILKVFEVVKKVASTNANVLILGESGTGKELVARALHFNSNRSEKRFLALNCGALPGSLLESEMFGHVRGAFTGAASDKKGHFRSVEGGTLFLDEIGEMPMDIQVKLLRALQEHEVTPVGSSTSEKFDARIVSATNKDLAAEVASGRFREDLYYRLNVIDIILPPLRARRDDIPLLVKHFTARAERAQNEIRTSVSGEAMSILAAYDWPGNIRELENVIERAVILSNGEIRAEDLPSKLAAASEDNSTRGIGSLPTLNEVERHYIRETLRSVEDDKARAAEILGIDLSTLYRKLKRY
jgi:DNA-binding NtrC family response regulator